MAPTDSRWRRLRGVVRSPLARHDQSSRRFARPAVAAQIAQQTQQEDAYFHAAFQPYAAASSSRESASTPLDAAAAMGKPIFDAQGCGKCHGEGGQGAEGPALTHIGSLYPPTQLTALLKAPTAKMTTAGMVPLTLDAAKMTALVSYLSSLGGASSASVATPAASAAPSPLSAKAEPVVTLGPSQAATKASAEPAAASRKGPGTALPGEKIYQAEGCASCHGAGGIGTSKAPALTTLSATPAALTGLLQHPTDAMRAGGMPPVKATRTNLSALVAYLKSLRTPGTVTAAARATSTGASSSNVSPAVAGPPNALPLQTPSTPPTAASKSAALISAANNASSGRHEPGLGESIGSARRNDLQCRGVCIVSWRGRHWYPARPQP